MDFLIFLVAPRFGWATLGGIFQQLGIVWMMHCHPRRAHIILVVYQWWLMLRKFRFSFMCLPIMFRALLLLQIPSSLLIFPSMYICSFTCYRSPGVMLWRLQVRPLSSWRLWVTEFVLLSSQCDFSKQEYTGPLRIIYIPLQPCRLFPSGMAVSYSH